MNFNKTIISLMLAGLSFNIEAVNAGGGTTPDSPPKPQPCRIFSNDGVHDNCPDFGGGSSQDTPNQPMENFMRCAETLQMKVGLDTLNGNFLANGRAVSVSYLAATNQYFCNFRMAILNIANQKTVNGRAVSGPASSDPRQNFSLEPVLVFPVNGQLGELDLMNIIGTVAHGGYFEIFETSTSINFINANWQFSPNIVKLKVHAIEPDQIFKF